jgi:Ca2+-binding RTX toxin-like protein
MIDVKAIKETDASTVPAEKYRFRDSELLSRLPLYITLAITAVAAFVKGTTPDLRLPQPEEPDVIPDKTPGMTLAAPFHPIDPERPTEETPPSQPEGSARQEAGILKSGRYDNVVPFVRPHTLVDSPVIRYEAPKLAESEPFDPPASDGPNTSPIGGTPQSPAGPRPDADPQRRNRAPESTTGPVRLTEAFAGTTIIIGLDELLRGMTDADGDQLVVKNVRVSSGSLAAIDGGFIYSSNAATLPKTVTVTYEVTDGKETVLRTAEIPLSRGPIKGSSTSETVLGTPWDDQIDALAGGDIIDAMDGDDFIVGGEGDDIIVAGAGNDVVFAGLGDDVVFAGSGDDMVAGGEGDDRLSGDAGDDVLLGEAGDDQISGGEGDDVASGGDGDDLVKGDEGDDLLDGGAGNDTLQDGAGSDRVLGGEGDDVAVASLDAVTDFFAGGEGIDVLDYSAATESVVFNFVAGTAEGVEVGTDTVIEFEQVVGGSGADVFLIGDQELTLTGGDGEDTFIFALPENVDRPMLVHDILDFVVGDRVKVAAFEFTMNAQDEHEDRFGHYYRDRDDEDPDALKLRIRHETDDDQGELTVFEFDADGNFDFEMTIAVHGNHQPFVYETATA